ncbi:hypothetical protein BGX28_006146 [Mortierella sp. GBA30]|nr:hypothetical protein BGX28_006146 [Mortierella sp. GBA30]
MAPWTCTPEHTGMCLSDSLVQLIPTCIIVFSSLAVISAECGRQDRRRMFNTFSSEVVVQGESQMDLDVDGSNPTRLIKPKRTFPLAILRCLGAFAQIGLFTYLAFQKLAEQNQNGPGIPSNASGTGPGLGPRIMGIEINEEWPLWLPVMHGIVWVYAAILSVVSLLHPRLSNPYRLVTHLDIIYLTTAGGGLANFMENDFGRPIGLWSLDDQISGLSALISGAMLVLTLATKPLVPPQPIKGPEKRSRGVISPETRSSLYARIAFTWLHPMVKKSVLGKLQETDVWAMETSLRVKTVFQDYLENRRPTVFVTMLHLFRLDLALQYLWGLAWAGLNMVPPFVVFKLLQFAQDITTYNHNEALFYVAALLSSIIVRSAVLQRGLHMSQRVATKAMGMTSGLIYEKMSLRKDMDPYNYDISDLMSVDVKHIGQGWKQVFHLMIYPTMFVLATVQLHNYIGHSAWAAGLAVMAWYPISALASFLFSGRFDPAPPKMNRSNALVSDILANLKAIKYLAWEEILMTKALKAREEERKTNSKVSQPVMTLISVPLGGDLIHAFVMVVILAFHSLYFGRLLTPAVLFTTLILVDIQTNAINSLPPVVISVKEMLDALVRVNDFLGDDENDRDTAVIRDREMARRANIPIIGFVNATFVWPEAKPVHNGNEVLFVEEPYEDDDENESAGNGSDRRNKKSRKSSRVNTNWVVRTLSLFGYSLPTPPKPYYASNNPRPKYGAGLGSNASATDTDFALKNVTLSFPPGQVSLVTGTRRSGKSALLLALIGEMTRISGKIYMPRKDYYHGKQGYGSDIAYVAQDPWLEIGGGGSITGSGTGRSTIRDTILFGTTMDEARYVEVLRACVLDDELRGLPNGDMTIIGDKNVIWSMSLKQRISLARAVYSDVSHILMDDCLSFVDVKSRHFIWKNCLLGPIMQNKTRILVSNQFHVKTYLNDVDYVVGIDQGIVLGHGTVKEVLSQGWIRQAPGSSSIPTTIVPGASVPANMGQLPPRNDQPQQNLVDAVPSNAPSQELRSSKSTNLPLNKMSNLSDYDDLDSTLSRETAAGFKVGWSTFGTYIFSLGAAPFLLSAFVCLFLGQTLFVARIGWLGLWAENEAWDGELLLQRTLHYRQHQPLLSNSAAPQALSHFDYIQIFIAFAAVRSLFVIANAFFMRAGAFRGADRIFTRLLQSVVSARLTVFEANAEKANASTTAEAGGLFTKGTINGIKDCFQRDLVGLDVKLAKEFWQFSADFLSFVLILVVLAWVHPFIVIPVAIVLCMLTSVALLGLGLSKEMHRMAIRADRMDKDQFKHTFRGLATIRGYGLERRAIKAGIAHAEFYLKTTYFGSCADRWLHWKVDLLGAFIPFSCAVLVLGKIEVLDPVLVGLSLYLSLQFSDKVLDSLLGYGRIRNRLQWALERTRGYIHNLDSHGNREAPRVVLNKTPPAAWPHSGAVEYVNFSCNIPESALMDRTVNKQANGTSGPTLDQAEVVHILERSSPSNSSANPNIGQVQVPYQPQTQYQGRSTGAAAAASQPSGPIPPLLSQSQQPPYQPQTQYEGPNTASTAPMTTADPVPSLPQQPPYQPQKQYQVPNTTSAAPLTTADPVPSLPQQPPYQPQTQYQGPNAASAIPLPAADAASSVPLANSSIRTNTVASAANTVASGTSHFSSLSHSTVATNGTLVASASVHGYPAGSENSIATLVPLPTPSSTFRASAPVGAASSATVPMPADEPMDQLSNLNQTDIPDQNDIQDQTDNQDQRFDAPLPPLPPSAVTPTPTPAPAPVPVPASVPTPGPTASANGQTNPNKINNQLATENSSETQVGFGPVTCTILPGEKVAVVGQSKSGKSTFIQSLFRIWDTATEDRIRATHAASNTTAVGGSLMSSTNNNSSQKKPTPGSNSNSKSKPSSSPLSFLSRGKAKSFHDADPDLGAIIVDGLDISQLGLIDLRSRFAYLSMRGTVFAGTVRFNLDPRGEHEDAELNEVLRICYLNERVKLDTELITPATATVSTVAGSGTASSDGYNGATTSDQSSRITKYRKRFFRKSRADQNNKGKGKANKNQRTTASAPATIGVASGRSGLQQSSVEGNGQDLSAHVDQRLAQASQEHEHDVEATHDDDTDGEHDEDDDDSRVELDTNERQLLSLARILVQRPNVVVLDNIASKVTDLTAQRIDQIVVQELRHATVLSVGHRLDQIVARHNRILVLDHGRIAEFDTPIALLNKPDGVFRNICNPAGPNFSSLVSLAKKQQQPQE